MRPAVIVIDMLEDFFNGDLKCERAGRILKPLGRLLEGARGGCSGRLLERRPPA